MRQKCWNMLSSVLFLFSFTSSVLCLVCWVHSKVMLITTLDFSKLKKKKWLYVEYFSIIQKIKRHLLMAFSRTHRFKNPHLFSPYLQKCRLVHGSAWACIYVCWGGGEMNGGMTNHWKFSGKCLCLTMEEAADLGQGVSITKSPSLWTWGTLRPWRCGDE